MAAERFMGTQWSKEEDDVVNYLQQSTRGRPFNETDETLDDAVQSVFELNDEDAELEWNGVVFSLNYKYDLGMMVDDVVSHAEDDNRRRRRQHGDCMGSPAASRLHGRCWSDDRISLSSNLSRLSLWTENIGTRGAGNLQEAIVREWQSVLVTIKAKLVPQATVIVTFLRLRELCGPMLPGQTSG
jgi:hypothetical protein